jgi:hypothetical protein
MKTVGDLGRETKRKNPGAYDHLSDEEVGRRMKRKRPDKYSEYEDTSMQTYTNSSFSSPREHSMEQLDHFVEQLDTIASRFNVNRGVLGTFFQRKRYEGQAKLIQVIAEEMTHIIGAMNLRAEAHAAHTRHQFVLEMESLIHQNQAMVYMLANAAGMDLNLYLKKMEYQLEIDKEIILTQERSRIKVEEARILSEIKIAETRALTEIDIRKAYIQKLGIADIESAMILLDKLYDAQRNYYALRAVNSKTKAHLKELEAAKALLEDLEKKWEEGWGSLIKRNERVP